MADSTHTSTAFLIGGGELAMLIARHDWSGALGPLESWPLSLKTAVGLMLHSPVPLVLLWGPDGVMLYNDAYSVFAGNRHPGLLGSKVREGWPEVADFNDNVMRVGLAGGSLSYRNQELSLDRSGKLAPAWMDLFYSPVIDESGRPGGVIAVVVETTDKVITAKNLAESEQRLQTALSAGRGIGTWDWDVPGDRVVADARFARLYGVDPERARAGCPIAEFFAGMHPDDRPRVEAEVEQGVRTGERFNSTYRLIQPNGDVCWVEAEGQCTRDAQGRPLRFSGFTFDVTERVEAQAALQENAERLRFLDALGKETARSLDADAILSVTTRMVGEYLGVSVCAYADMDADEEGFTIRGDWSAPGSASIQGYYRLPDFGRLAMDNLTAGKPLIVHDNGKELAPQEAATFQAIGIRATICMPLVREGRLTALMAIYDKAPRLWTANELAVITEVTERSWAHIERARAVSVVRASENQFRTMAQAMPNHVWTASPDGLLDWFNHQVYAYSGAAPGSLDGTAWTSIVHPDDLDAAAAAWGASVSAGRIYQTEFRLRRADGQWRWHLARAVPVRDQAGEIQRWIGTNTDIHDQKEIAEVLESRVAERTSQLQQTEDALRQAQKMEAVGQLTGGIAHDFNNLLQGITGALDRVQHRIAQGRPQDAERFLKAALESANRAAALTHRLLAFSRRQTLDPCALDPNRLIAGMEELIRRTMGPPVTVEVVGAGGLWPILADPSQLENSLLNLCINARDAMPGGGKLTIETANKWLDERAAKDRELPPGQYVSLCVSDTGTGMTPEVIARAFDPFFTTKPLGQGTGLGLSMIYGFVRQSGGQVRIYSEENSGTTICLYFPRHLGPVEEADADAGEPVERGFGETVLVVDDEPTVRMLITEVLSENYYNILEASDGAAALKILQAGHRVDLLITDVGLPGGMNGRQVADAARVTRPGLKVLFITGYAENAVVGNGHLDAGMEILAKPFAMATLAGKVRAMIES